MSRRCTVLALAVVGFALGVVAAQALMVDNFEQSNGNNNSLTFWSDLYVDISKSTGGFLPDVAGIQKKNSFGALLYYSNGVGETAACKFYSVLSTNAPYRDLSALPQYVRFWIRASDGTPSIDRVILEGSSTSHYGRVRFADYNDGSDRVLADWREISIPIADFLGDTGGSFSLSQVALFAFTFTSTGSLGHISTVLLDDLQVAGTPPPAPLTVTTNVMIDDFEQLNGNDNGLWLWSDLYADQSSVHGWFIPDTIDAKRNGSYGGFVIYSNGPAVTTPSKFYTVLAEGWPYVNLAARDTFVRFWIRNYTGSPAIDRVILEGGTTSRYGRVAFSNYNAGASAVRPGWHEISIPSRDFLSDSSPSFSLSNAALLAFTFDNRPTTGLNSAIFLDDILLATNPAPSWRGQPVTNTLMIDDFEQANGNANSLSLWSDGYTLSNSVLVGVVADLAGVQKNGLNGGVFYYSNSTPQNVECGLYSILSAAWPHLDLSVTNLYLRFWIKRGDGTPAVDSVSLKCDTTGRSRVPFIAYNNGSASLDPDWFEVSIPVTNFLSGAIDGDFELSRVSVLELQVTATASVGRTSSFFLDDIQFARTPAPPQPSQSTIVTQALMIDNFEQNNSKPNTLGYWSDLWSEEADGSCGFMPDLADAVWYGARGGKIYYLNGPGHSSDVAWYTVLATNAPYFDLSKTSLYVRFWLRSDSGTAVLDRIMLQGPETRFGLVSFSNYNHGSSIVSSGWSEVSIPVADFMSEISGPFSLGKVAGLTLKFKRDPSRTYPSSVMFDDVQISPDPSSPPVRGEPVVLPLMVDDFEQGNGNNNSLGRWSAVYAPPAETAGYIADCGGAQRNGSLGGVIYYANTPTSPTFKYYSVLSEPWPNADLGGTNLYLRFWVKANEGTPGIDKVYLQGRDIGQFGEVDFAPYNGGTARLGAGWNEISIPLSNFLARTQGSFSLYRVGVLGFTLLTNNSYGQQSSFYIDDIQVSPLPAPVPAPVAIVSNVFIVDDFEQGNSNPNTLGGWANTWCDEAQSSAGFIPDFANVQHDGTLGGVVFYSNSASASAACSFYTVLTETWPFVDVSWSNAALQFWIRGADGAPAITRIELQGDSDKVFGRVNYADYNGGQNAVGPSWRLIHVPVTNFLANTGGGFRSTRVKSISIAFDPASSAGFFSSVWIDTIRIVDVRDADVDGMNDAWETSHFGAPGNCTPGGDADGDGGFNIDEYVADTDPLDSNSVFRIENLVWQNSAKVYFDSSSQRSYDLIGTTNLVTGSWTVRATADLGNGGELQLTDPTPGPFSAYRLRARIP